MHLQWPFPNPDGADQRDFDKVMSKVRIELNGSLVTLKLFFKFVDFKKQSKIELNAVGKHYLVCARVRLYGNMSITLVYRHQQYKNVFFNNIC